jgi:hypothetical protein
MKLPTLTKLHESPNATRWKAQFPSTLTKQGAAYRVSTYPDSDLVFIETWVKHRQVSGERIADAIRKAVAAQKEQV